MTGRTNHTLCGTTKRLLPSGISRAGGWRQNVGETLMCLLLCGALPLPVAGAFRPVLPGRRAGAALCAAFCLCAGLFLVDALFSFSDEDAFSGWAMAADFAERETAGTPLPGAGTKSPASGAASPEMARTGRGVPGEPPGSRELTRELYRLLHPEQAPARVPERSSSLPPPSASGRSPAGNERLTAPSALSKDRMLPPDKGPENSASQPPDLTSSGSEASAGQLPTPTPSVSEPLAKQPSMPTPPVSEPSAPDSPVVSAGTALPAPAAPKTPEAPLAKKPSASPAKAAAVAPPKTPAALPAVEPHRWTGGSPQQGDVPASLPAKTAVLEADAGGREPGAASPPAGQGKKAKPPEGEGAARKGGEPAEALSRQNIVRAEIRPVNLMVLSAPYDGVISAVLVRDGDSVSKGQAVARLDTQAEEQALAVAQTLAADAFNRLGVLPEGPSRDRDVLAAEYIRHSAEVRLRETRLAQGVITAPFAATVTEVRVRAGEHVRQGGPIAEIAESGALEVVSSVPSVWIRWLKPGHIVWVYVDETARSYEAVLDRLGGKVDPASKTLRVYARFTGTHPELLPGMSGSASIRPQLAEEKDAAKAASGQKARHPGQEKPRQAR